MITGKKILWIMLLGVSSLFAQSTEYLIVDAPFETQSDSRVIWIKWAGLARGIGYAAPDSGTIYYDRAPGGGNLANYRYTIANPWIDTVTGKPQSNILDTSGNIRKRGTAFKASEQPGMGFGVFYCVVALPSELQSLISNEFVLMIESPNAVDWTGPKDTITELTPTFQWAANSGVPYYHVILSDDRINVDTAGGVSLAGLSIIWQAITPSTQIVYGAPDPSQTITAVPPPLSPGKTYTWIVLNNYGNHPAFSSTKIKIPPGEFTIKGQALKKPVPVFPDSVTLNSAFKFKWTNLDKNANTYKVYVYVGSDFEGINAQLVMWQTEVMADPNADTMSVEIDAPSILTDNKYTWRAIAVDEKGAGSVGDTLGFWYSAPSGTLRVYTKEIIRVPVGDMVIADTNDVGLVQVKVEVLDGSLEAPLLYYTDKSGYLSRKRATGAYRISAVKDEFITQTRTITLREGQTLTEMFYLERPEATIFGKVVDEANKGINLANVIGISDLNDTVKTKTDASGNFILKCSASDWRIWSEMTGYNPVLPAKVTVTAAQNLNFGTMILKKNPYTLSGSVKNSAGSPLLGANVRIYRNGVLLDEVASTPQNGTFSFSIPAGTYTITSEKTGFTSFSSSIDMLSSKSMSITMQPGATVVKGYVYGKTWIAARNDYVLAPITNAKITFVKNGTTDTTTVTSNFTYGDFSVSLPGEQKYNVYSSATGYAPKSAPVVCSTAVKTTQMFYDTLNAYATVNGVVRVSSDNSFLGGCIVNLIRVPQGTIGATGKSNADGTFEIRNIADGIYTLISGKDGYVLDSIGGNDTLTIVNGKPDRATLGFYMKIGDKKIKWVSPYTGAIKLVSPLQKTLSLSDSITTAGSGVYVMSFDANEDSVIDLSYHRFRVADSEMVHIDTLPIVLTHTSADSLVPIGGYVPLAFRSKDTLDSAMVCYKDMTAASYTVLKTYQNTDLTYTFSIMPTRDGSTMQYYFVGYRGNDIYGYDKETFNVFIQPDSSRLSRYEIVPSSDDALVLPSSYSATFSFNGYYSSSFIPDTYIDPQSIKWTLANAQGCAVQNSNGTTVVVKTGSAPTFAQPVTLTATIDTAKTKLIPGLPNSVSVVFIVSGTKLTSIKVRRTDPQNPSPITTSNTDKAEFVADGYDNAGNILQISPVWKIMPLKAGTISKEGIFRPSRNFIGTVQIIAEANNVSGEYRINESTEPGLQVRFMITRKNTPDTASDGQGCMIIFPPQIVSDNDIGIVELAKKNADNTIKTKQGKVQMITSSSYDIKQLENVAFNTNADSIILSLEIPKEYNATGKELHIGHWLPDSIKWEILENTVVKDNRYVTAKLAHFSEYTILAESKKSGYLSVSPNTFSPYVNQGQVNVLTPYYGTCIKFQLESDAAVFNARLQIFNIVGDLVWSMELMNVENVPYAVWWDGKTTSKDIMIDRPSQVSMNQMGESVIVPKGEKMCRNGRYFVVLTAKDTNKKTFRYMKPVVLMK